MRHLAPNRNEQPRVAGQALQVAFACGAVPDDQGIAIRALQAADPNRAHAFDRPSRFRTR